MPVGPAAQGSTQTTARLEVRKVASAANRAGLAVPLAPTDLMHLCDTIQLNKLDSCIKSVGAKVAAKAWKDVVAAALTPCCDPVATLRR